MTKPITCTITSRLNGRASNRLADFTCTFTFYDEALVRHLHDHVKPEVDAMLSRLLPPTLHGGPLQ
jgi:hypothetical protein